ncbi:hypothetical protein [Mucilaginibacter pedocola]|uniref:Uncharacterized protein n=1 Tax=Mucilaginibacter pedocola TaxID=1792845 RepID=A0A1S9P883_9SPHI|nr:hypothetical protein [Mucilaginibacter pedocola]OOQ57154.1 hypothetical protein BC343_16675 [Mucilaginibacter pedocola]
MAETVIAATLELDSSQASKSIKQLKTEINEASEELKKLKQAFGDTSEQATKAAEKITELESSIKTTSDSATDANPKKTFDDFAESVKTTVAGVRALNDTLQLVGLGSKDVEDALKKVEGAMSFADKIRGNIQSFMALKTVAVDAFKSINVAISSTGVGALLLGLAAVVAYWDKIKGAISGVSAEQKANLAAATENADQEKEKLAHINDQDNILKSQGKSEKDILQIKSNQVKKTIEASEAQLNAQKIADKAAIKTAERNRNLLTMLMQLSSAPLEALTMGIDAIGKALGKDFGLNDMLNKGLKSVASLVFDPEGMQEEADKSYKAQEDGLLKLKNQKAGYDNGIAEQQKREKQKLNAFEKELRGIKNEGEEARLADAKELAKKQLEHQYINQQKEITQSEKTQEQKNTLLLEAEKTFHAKLDKLDKEQNDAKAAREKTALDQLAKMREDNDIEAIANKQKHDEARIQADYEAQEREIKGQDISNQTKDQLLTEALRKRDRLLKQNNAENATVRIEELKSQANDETLSHDERLAAIEEWHTKIINNTTITEQDRKKILQENVDARKAIDEAELAHKKEMADNLFKLNDLAVEFAGKNTLAGKVLAVTAATISTYLSAQKAYESQLIAFDPSSVIRATIAAAVAVASGLANIKKIVAVQVPGAPGGSAPSVAAGAPAPIVPKPQAVNTQLPQDQINQIGNATVRAYVLEQDIDKDSSRTTRLNRAARLGG